MRYSKSYRDYQPMIERQPKPSGCHSFGAAITAIGFGMIFYAMYLGWTS